MKRSAIWVYMRMRVCPRAFYGMRAVIWQLDLWERCAAWSDVRHGTFLRGRIIVTVSASAPDPPRPGWGAAGGTAGLLEHGEITRCHRCSQLQQFLVIEEAPTPVASGRFGGGRCKILGDERSFPGDSRRILVWPQPWTSLVSFFPWGIGSCSCLG